ncbi:MAG: hypothetical protein V1792_27175 [Pseudomonadota bacterium]
MKSHSLSVPLVFLTVISCIPQWVHATGVSASGQPPLMAPMRVNTYTQGFYADVAARWVTLMQVDLNVVAGDGGFSAEGRPLDNQSWGPAVEVGYMASHFFDVFSAFSWYELTSCGQTYGETDAETLTFQLDLADYQFRVGARSWIPLYGMGRFGVNCGGVISVIPFDLDVGRAAGGLIMGASHADTWTAFGGFAGIDTELNYGRTFAKARIEGTLVTGNQYEQLLGMAANVNTSGFSFSVGGGVRF